MDSETGQAGLGAIIDAMSDEVVLLDSDGTIIGANRAWRKFGHRNGGGDPTGFMGQNYIDICFAADGETNLQADRIGRGLRAVLEGEGSFRTEYSCHGPEDQRWFEMVADPVMQDGRRMAIVQHRDVTLREASRQGVLRNDMSNEMLSALIASSQDAILCYDLEGDIISWNPAAARLYGYTDDEALGEPLDMIFPADQHTGVSEYRQRILSGELQSFDADRVTSLGRTIHVWITAAPVRDGDGRIVGIASFHRDVTEAKRDEETRNLMTREVNHRSKNLLSMISAIHRQSALTARSLEEFTDDFSSRIEGVGQSMDMLVSGQWSEVRLGDLLRRQIDILWHREAKRVTLDGPDGVRLFTGAAQAIGMSVHELVANAMKYGALRNGAGAVEISWTVIDPADAENEDEEGALRVIWKETGIEIASDRSEGFGSALLSNHAGAIARATSEYRIGSDRIDWQMTVPATEFRLADRRFERDKS